MGERRLILEERRYFLAVQDGRADNREFDTYEEAQSALRELPPTLRLGTYVDNYIKRSPFP